VIGWVHFAAKEGTTKHAIKEIRKIPDEASDTAFAAKDILNNHSSITHKPDNRISLSKSALW
jgi:hypothetical protein